MEMREDSLHVTLNYKIEKRGCTLCVFVPDLVTTHRRENGTMSYLTVFGRTDLGVRRQSREDTALIRQTCGEPNRADCKTRFAYQT
jgi:hypothetical protein